MTPVPVDPIAAITPPLRPPDRVTVRRRLPDGSATDVIGWVRQLDDAELVLIIDPQTDITIERATIIVARRVPPARGGRDPLATDAAELERIALAGWIDRRVALGDWTLRDADGFTRRAGSCLAVGDPGLGLAQAAERVIDFYRSRDRSPLVQVITGSDVEREFRDLGWVVGGPDTDVLVCRLADLVGDRLTGTAVSLEESPTAAWLAALQAQRGQSTSGTAARRVIAGTAPVVFASIEAEEEVTAVGRGIITAGWLGVSAVWTRPEHRRRGLSREIMTGIAGWAALRGARSVYLQVEQQNVAAQAAYAALGLVRHHSYVFLRPPTS